ncbi:aminoglycoside 6-adenylyltransferase [Desulfosporosinus sp. SB140]|uniref:aminoglycoside 6-adenylyltransferase n=1 Tax=Desulfosporosinus paludis TaxID=3115649 RepID=UPI00388FE999
MRAVLLGGSRINQNAIKDIFQEYDIRLGGKEIEKGSSNYDGCHCGSYSWGDAYSPITIQGKRKNNRRSN